jgi:SAM-dependent methyltransferase
MTQSTSIFYRDSSARVPLVSRLSLRARTAIYARFAAALPPRPDATVLDLGVTSDATFAESNFFERLYPYKSRITGAGTEDGSHLEAEYPGLRFVPVVAGQPLPFADRQFDVVFCNAVIEHVGGPAGQCAFLAEALRVARAFFFATPNRWFPVEPHTCLPLLHYLPRPWFRAVLRPTRYRHWADEASLNLLTRGELRRRFPDGTSVTVERVGIGPGILRSNLVAFGRRD